jgi:hypothetical protein
VATERWGTPGAWTDTHTGTTLNSLANGNALAGLAIDNSTLLDVFCDVSLQLASLTAATPNYVGLYLYPRAKDGTTYGDNRFGSAAAGPPPSQYWVGNFGFATGASVKYGTITGILLPAGFLKFVLYNQAGVTWAASGNTCQYRAYDRVIA